MILQQAGADRIVKSKTNNVDVYKLRVLPGDIASNGNRAEIVPSFISENNHTYNYSWDFKINGEFRQSELARYHFIIAQWWNGSGHAEIHPKGYKNPEGPPFFFSVVTRKQVPTLQIWYGLQGTTRKVENEIPLTNDKWYHVNVRAYWSTDTDGYATVNINGADYELHGANKYNSISNVFKLGLYRNKDNRDTTEEYLQNISISEIKKQ